MPREVAEMVVEIGGWPEVTLDDIPLDVAVRYAARDADATCRIDAPLATRHANMGLGQVEEIDLGALPMFERMQSNGILIDKQHFRDFGIVLEQGIESLRTDIEKLAGEPINPSSGDQVAYLLFGKLDLKIEGRTPRKTAGGTRESTNEKVLQAYRDIHPVVSLIIDYREMVKLKGTYADELPNMTDDHGRIHGDFKITRTPTGQLAVSNPNLLAQPTESTLGREIRRGFVAPPGHVLGTWDLDQFHMRVMAHLSGDENLCKLFREGKDLHTITAAQLFGISESRVDKMKHRFPAKRTGFGIINGITEIGLSAQFDKAKELGAEPHPPDECAEFIAGWFKLYPGVKRMHNEAIAEARRYGYARDMWGRIQYLPNIHSHVPALRAEAERQSYTLKTHGSAFGILKKGMARIWDYLNEFWKLKGDRVEPLLQVHDELLFELTDQAALKNHIARDFTDLLCSAVELSVPIGAHNAFGYNWGDLEK